MVGAQGQVKLATNVLHLWRHSQKTHTLQQMQTRVWQSGMPEVAQKQSSSHKHNFYHW